MTPSRPTTAPRARVVARSSARSSSPAGSLFAARERPERPSFGRSPEPGRPGAITAAQAAGYKAAGAIPGVKTAAAHAFITTYVNNTFPSHIDCTATFVDENPMGVFKKTPPQAVKITNDQ